MTLAFLDKLHHLGKSPTVRFLMFLGLSVQRIIEAALPRWVRELCKRFRLEASSVPTNTKLRVIGGGGPWSFEYTSPFVHENLTSQQTLKA